MEICTYKKDNSYFQFECSHCLCFWNMDKLEMTDNEIRELARR